MTHDTKPAGRSPMFGAAIAIVLLLLFVPSFRDLVTEWLGVGVGVVIGASIGVVLLFGGTRIRR